jgi:hypothetical protein
MIKMVKSNINITSNIYVRSDSDIRKDIKYTEKITGSEKIRYIKNNYFGLATIKLTDIQEKIAKESVFCNKARNGERSFGPILVEGSMRWVNRCENIRCNQYEKCISKSEFKLISREIELEEDKKENDDIKGFLKSLGIKIQDDNVIFEHDKNLLGEIEEESKVYVVADEQPVTEINSLNSLYNEITETDCIINAPLNSHIILNSGPGTGKTYTVIHRLIHILANNLCPADEIYILCYTRSAKKVVEDKVDAAVMQGLIQPSAKDICILTFDSYATYFLMAMNEQEVIKEDFTGYDYNVRINMFNKYVSSEDFEGISYFIVDEIQDLVNERAKMVLKILEHLKCGYLLAGDRCQSIYDYEADNDATLDSVKFYKLLEKQFPDDILRYEISVNRRQSSTLATESLEMRKILLNESFNMQNKEANKVVKKYSNNMKIETYIKNMPCILNSSTAILCRNNGEAEYVSGLLCEKSVCHTLNRGVNTVNPLPRWIADVFWDYCRETISRNEFIERYNLRCNFKLYAEDIWEYFCKMIKSSDKSAISINKLIDVLTVSNNMPIDFYEEAPLLTVSTIHKAKGSEFDKVILIESFINSSNDSAEEARVIYVAITRPKSQFITMKKNVKYFKRTISGRVIETGLHSNYNKRNRFCKGITIGLSGDIDNNSFVTGDFDLIIDLQEYIIQNIKLYDKLTAERSADTGIYKIFHNGHCIGVLSKSMISEIDHGVESTDYKYGRPNGLKNLYVSGITTEILKKFNFDIPMEYQKSKICYGIQITGLARLIFEKK